MIVNKPRFCYKKRAGTLRQQRPTLTIRKVIFNMAYQTDITPETLRQLLEYDPHTGILTWRHRPAEMFTKLQYALSWNARRAGKPALCAVDKRGYLHGNVLEKWVFAHRAAWVIFHGEWPDDQIDHINGDKGDNRIANLRSVTGSENLRNKSLYRTNTTQFPGVHLSPNGRWQAKIQQINLGFYITKAEAVAARKAAEICLGYHTNHGRPK